VAGSQDETGAADVIDVGAVETADLDRRLHLQPVVSVGRGHGRLNGEPTKAAIVPPQAQAGRPRNFNDLDVHARRD
jgi:hypothetical protein